MRRRGGALRPSVGPATAPVALGPYRTALHPRPHRLELGDVCSPLSPRTLIPWHRCAVSFVDSFSQVRALDAEMENSLANKRVTFPQATNQRFANDWRQPIVNIRWLTLRKTLEFADTSGKITPLITVWLEVRVLPGPPPRFFALDFICLSPFPPAPDYKVRE